MYDGSGRLVTSELDFDGDGVVDALATYTYGNDGCGDVVEFDRVLDGSVDERWTLTHDLYEGECRLLRLDEDLGANGSVDYSHLYTFNQAGQLETYEADLDGDERPNYRDEYVYDSDGVLRQVDHDTNADGTVDVRDTWLYECV
jgi:hypothetical protein